MRIVTPPTLEPVSLALAKDQLGILEDVLDAVLRNRITAARKWIENYCDRALLPQTIEIRLDAFPGGQPIPLPWQDPIAVLSIQYVDQDGVVQTVDPADYVLDTYADIGFIRLAYAKYWPATRPEPNAVRVRYRAGYGSTAVGAAKTISSATQANPGVFTSTGHGFANDDILLLSVTGMTEIDGNLYPAYGVASDTFQLANLSRTAGVATDGYGSFIAGTAQKVTLNIEEGIIDSLINIVGHWTNYQQQIQNGGHLTRVPSAICRVLDQYRTRFF